MPSPILTIEFFVKAPLFLNLKLTTKKTPFEVSKSRFVINLLFISKILRLVRLLIIVALSATEYLIELKRNAVGIDVDL